MSKNAFVVFRVSFLFCFPTVRNVIPTVEMTYTDIIKASVLRKSGAGGPRITEKEQHPALFTEQPIISTTYANYIPFMSPMEALKENIMASY